MAVARKTRCCFFHIKLWESEDSFKEIMIRERIYSMDTPTIALYYKEPDPLKRKKLLDESVSSGEDEEANALRQQLWEIRYGTPGEKKTDGPADGFLGLWMTMECNRNSSGKFFGWKAARKEILKQMNKLKFQEFQEKSDLHKELLYRECCHLVHTYMELCKIDKTYNTQLFGIMPIKEENAKNKLKKDIYETAVRLPVNLNLEEELDLITRAAKEVYELHFPGEGGL